MAPSKKILLATALVGAHASEQIVHVKHYTDKDCKNYKAAAASLAGMQPVHKFHKEANKCTKVSSNMFTGEKTDPMEMNGKTDGYMTVAWVGCDAGNVNKYVVSADDGSCARGKFMGVDRTDQTITMMTCTKRVGTTSDEWEQAECVSSMPAKASSSSSANAISAATGLFVAAATYLLM